jgi:hypothetical protein
MHTIFIWIIQSIIKKNCSDDKTDSVFDLCSFWW